MLCWETKHVHVRLKPRTRGAWNHQKSCVQHDPLPSKPRAKYQRPTRSLEQGPPVKPYDSAGIMTGRRTAHTSPIMRDSPCGHHLTQVEVGCSGLGRAYMFHQKSQINSFHKIVVTWRNEVPSRRATSQPRSPVSTGELRR